MLVASPATTYTAQLKHVRLTDRPALRGSEHYADDLQQRFTGRNHNLLEEAAERQARRIPLLVHAWVQGRSASWCCIWGLRNHESVPPSTSYVIRLTLYYVDGNITLTVLQRTEYGTP